MTNQDFLDAGYTRWEPSPYHECVTDLFEKLVSDDVGKKYFIHVEKWDFSKYQVASKIEPNYEAFVQFTEKGTRNAVNIKYLTGFTIEEMEAFYAKQWETGMYEYYEEWEK